MHYTPLQAFVGKVLMSRRLLYADLQRLQRDILPNGITSSSEAEALIALEAVLDRVDDGWPGYLAGALTAFVLSTSQPSGTVDGRMAAWLVGALENLPQKTATAIAREVALAARHVDSVLLNFLGKTGKGRAKARHNSPLRQAADIEPMVWSADAYEIAAVAMSCGEDCPSADPVA